MICSTCDSDLCLVGLDHVVRSKRLVLLRPIKVIRKGLRLHT